MYEQLKAIYREALVTEQEAINQPDNYYWFQDTAQTRFGLLKTAVTHNEWQLLTLQCQPVHPPTKTQTHAERFWERILLTGASPEQDVSESPFAFIHFYFKREPQDYDEVKQAVSGFFPGSGIMLWTSAQSGVIIHESAEQPEDIHELTELLAADLFLDAYLFHGPTMTDLTTAETIFSRQKQLFYLVRLTYPEQRTFQYSTLLPLELIKNDVLDHHPSFFHPIDARIKDLDQEIVDTVLTFLEHHMNISSAAKKLYIHRNSLQYRLERFTEKTGLDPKQFLDAVTIYLTLIKHRVESFVTIEQKK